MFKPYEERLGHPADFRIKYRFFSAEEGGRKMVPFQGSRSDFWYHHQKHNDYPNQIFMIWPEFEDANGKVILDDKSPVTQMGTARMWIIDPIKRDYHLDKIEIGTKDFFMEGSRKVAECEVIEILGLESNPTR